MSFFPDYSGFGGDAGGGAGGRLLHEDHSFSVTLRSRSFRFASGIVVSSEDAARLKVGDPLWSLGGTTSSNHYSQVYRVTAIHDGGIITLDPTLRRTTQAAEVMFSPSLIDWSDFASDPIVDNSIQLEGAPQNLRIRALGHDYWLFSGPAGFDDFYFDGFVQDGRVSSYRADTEDGKWKVQFGHEEEPGDILVVGGHFHDSNTVNTDRSTPDTPLLYYNTANGKLYFEQQADKTYMDRPGWYPAIWDIQVYGG